MVGSAKWPRGDGKTFRGCNRGIGGIYDAIAVKKAAVVILKKNHNLDRCTCVRLVLAAVQWSLCWKERIVSRG